MSKSFTPLIPPQAPTVAPGAQSSFQTAAVHTPHVSLKRDGDRVTHVTIQCGCGEVIELACEY
jgi:hypothetical protein